MTRLNGQALVETPPMRAEKLARAKALRMEADALLKEDGGKLTPVHEASVRGRVCDILGQERTDTGSHVSRQRCGA